MQKEPPIRKRKAVSPDDYSLALHRFLRADAYDHQPRISIMEKKPELVVQERRLKGPDGAEGGDPQSPQTQQQLTLDSQSEDS